MSKIDINEIKEKVAQALEEITEYEEVKDDYELDLIEANFIDSFGLVGLIVKLEEIFNISLPISEIQKEDFNTINKISKYVEVELEK